MPRTPDQGWNWKLYVHSDDLDRTAALWERSLATGAPYDVEYRVRCGSDGSYRWFMGRALPIRGDRGEITRWFGTCTDIDEQRRLAEARDALLAAERATRTEIEHAMRQRDEFVATLAHELRTPLNAILGWTQMLRRPVNPDVLARGLEVIERNTRAQAQIISDLLDIGHITSGQGAPGQESVNLLGIVRAAVSIVRPAADAKGVRLDAATEPAAIVTGDAARLQQLAWNLLSNAVKFTPAGGAIDVVAQRIDNTVELRVADSGEGIAPEFLPFIFDRYRQADAERHPLARRPRARPVAHQAHRRTARWHDRGLQRRARGAVRPFSCASQPPSPRTRRVSPPHWMCRSVGRTSSWSTTRPTDASWSRGSSRNAAAVFRPPRARSDAIAQLHARGGPDLIISDIAMPGMDGYELLIRLRSLEEGRRVPAIALTPFARAEDRTRSLLAGYQGHVPKPVDPGELLATVASLLQLSERSDHTPKGVAQ